MQTAALYLACGLDVDRATLFIQSHVPAHAQLARLLGAVTSVGQLRRMIQFKEKSKQDENATLALLDYPVLMAADILAYDADLVPVGDDQQQHLQLARDLAQHFNRSFGKGAELLKVPAAFTAAATARIMSLTDGTRKMSKSDPADASRINLLDSPDTVRAKLRRAKTDSVRGLEFDNPARPEAHNLLVIYQAATGKSKEACASECADMGYGQFKPLLTDALVALLEPMQKRYNELLSDRVMLMSCLNRGRQKAATQAERTLARATAAMGFVPM